MNYNPNSVQNSDWNSLRQFNQNSDENSEVRSLISVFTFLQNTNHNVI